MKKTIKKVIKKEPKTAKKPVKKLTKVQGADYWSERKLEDMKKDWNGTSYVDSVNHPHRNEIIKILQGFQWSYLLEVGCNSGPNLIKIKQNFPERALAGLDISSVSIEEAGSHLDRTVDLQVGNVLKLPHPDQSFDVVLVDAVLMYISPKEIDLAIGELNRVARKTIILIERYSEKDAVVGNVWGRDYSRLLKERGFNVVETRITKEIWPTSESWVKYGRIFVGIK